MQKEKRNNQVAEPRINNEITGYYEARVVYRKNNFEKSEEDFTRVMALSEAKKLSQKMELDLVEINPEANPPVLKLCDYSKYMYELKKSQKLQNRKTTEVKEIQLSPNISNHDLEIKARKAMEFMEDNNKVRVVMAMKRRELERRDESEKQLYAFIMLCESVGVAESMPKRDTTKTSVILKRKSKN